MPPKRRAVGEVLSPTTVPEQRYSFPKECHLLITTSRHVFAWDASGLQTIFRSNRDGIVTAREAKDGSGLLAVASKDVVVLHDTNRGRERSWGLNADEDTVRHLEYSHDAKSLFLSTTTSGAIQHYSTERSRLLNPSQTHSSSPTALALSPTGHLLVSAFGDPPLISLKSLAHNAAPTTLQPEASRSTVTCAAFHPERPNTFLVAFRDASIAAYDAAKIFRHNSKSSNSGEIGRFQRLHRAIMSEQSAKLAAPVAGAAFLPGYKTRAVTAGNDGKCRIIDFANGGTILRTWHARAPISSISVIANTLENQPGHGVRPSKRRRSGEHPQSTDQAMGTNVFIAVGRIDGQVHLYDSVGTLVAEKTITSVEEKIISIEWIKGLSPKSCDLDALPRYVSEAKLPYLSPRSQRTGTAATTTAGTNPRKSALKKIKDESGLGLPATLRRSHEVPKPTEESQRTVYPDEIDMGTVRIRPPPDRGCGPIIKDEYHDLFSPIKPVEEFPQLRLSSPLRNRPRISSQTFTKEYKSPTGEASLQHSVSGNKDSTFSNLPRRSVASPPNLEDHSKATKFKPSRQGSNKRAIIDDAPVRPNAKILADMRSLSGREAPARPNPGILSTYAISRSNQQATKHFPAKETTQGLPVVASIDRSRRKDIHVRQRDTWPTDSTGATSLDDAGEDIWLTSESDVATFVQRKRALRTSKLVLDDLNTQTIKAPSTGTNSAGGVTVPPSKRQRTTDEYTEMVSSEPTSLLPDGTFAPASEDVRGLFPRTSSLSPAKKRHSPESQKSVAVLKEVAPNATAGRHPQSPWARAQSGRTMREPAIEAQENQCIPGDLDSQTSTSAHKCSTCPNIQARVHALEGEVAHLKGEVLALKAILRRNGVPFPTTLR